MSGDAGVGGGVLMSGKPVPLADNPLPRLFADLHAAGAAGTLMLRSGLHEKRIIMRKGSPAHIESNIAQEALDRFLVARGELTEEVAADARIWADATHRAIGELLVEMGTLQPNELFKALKRSMGARILSTFSWVEGEASYDDNPPDIDRKIMLRVNPAPLVVRGVCSYTPLEVIRGDFRGAMDLPYQLYPGARDHVHGLRLNTTEGRIVNALTRARTIDELVVAARVEEELAVRLLYALKLLRMVGRAEDIAPDAVVPFDKREHASRPAPKPPSGRRPAARPVSATRPAVRPPSGKRPVLRPPSGERPAARSPSAKRPAARPPPSRPRPKVSVVEPARARAKEPAPKPQPPAARPVALSAGEQTEIDAAYMVSRSGDYCELLGLGDDFNFERLKQAFLGKCDRLSPAAYKGRDLGEHADRLEEIFLVLVRAFSTLAVPSTRKAHLAQMDKSKPPAPYAPKPAAPSVSLKARGSSPPSSAPALRAEPDQDDEEENAFAVDAPPEASTQVKTGVMFLNASQPAQALEHLRLAHNEDPDCAETMSFLGYALYLSDPISRLSEAVRYLQQAMASNPESVHPLLFLGRIFEVEQDRSSALGAYKDCLRIAPNNREARSAVERLGKLLG